MKAHLGIIINVIRIENLDFVINTRLYIKIPIYVLYIGNSLLHLMSAGVIFMECEDDVNLEWKLVNYLGISAYLDSIICYSWILGYWFSAPHTILLQEIICQHNNSNIQ